MSTHTPMRFLRKLGLISEFRENTTETIGRFQAMPDDWFPFLPASTPSEAGNLDTTGPEPIENPPTPEESLHVRPDVEVRPVQPDNPGANPVGSSTVRIPSRSAPVLQKKQELPGEANPRETNTRKVALQNIPARPASSMPASAASASAASARAVIDRAYREIHEATPKISPETSPVTSSMAAPAGSVEQSAAMLAINTTTSLQEPRETAPVIASSGEPAEQPSTMFAASAKSSPQEFPGTAQVIAPTTAAEQSSFHETHLVMSPHVPHASAPAKASAKAAQQPGTIPEIQPWTILQEPPPLTAAMPTAGTVEQEEALATATLMDQIDSTLIDRLLVEQTEHETGRPSVTPLDAPITEMASISEATEPVLAPIEPAPKHSASTGVGFETVATEVLVPTVPNNLVSNADDPLLREAQTPEQTDAPIKSRAELAVEAKAEKPSTSPQRRARIEEIVKERQPASQSIGAGKQRSRSPVPATTPEAKPDHDLFTKKADVDRSPTAWAEKLRQASSAGTQQNARSDERAESMAPRAKTDSVRQNLAVPAASTKSQTASVPAREERVIVPDTTRRFLKPLVGIDPATVPIYEGPLAAEFTAANQADGVAVAGNIVWNPGPVAETPQQLGLLAHELTHIARQRHARFIPPIVRRRTEVATPGPSPEQMDEEALARRVEAKVIDVASRAAEAPASAAGINAAPFGVPQMSPDPTDDATPTSLDTTDSWGGLPAPWEPLPDWVIDQPETQRSSATFSSVPPVAGSAVGESSTTTTMHEGFIERAEQGRVLNDSAPMSSSAAAEPQKTIAPDLDALARQVYSVLKRRLETEHRRLT